MKNALLSATAAALLCSCSNGQRFVVEGDIAGLEGTVYMFEGDSLLDSAVVTNGKFRFEGPADITARRTIGSAREGRPQKFGTLFFPEPGTITIVDAPGAPSGSTKVTGTPANDAGNAFWASAAALMDEYQHENTSEERRKEIEEEFNRLPGKAAEANRDNAFGIMALEGAMTTLSGQEALDLIARFSPQMQQAGEMAALRTMAGQRLKTDIGQPYINIMQGDADGQIVTLTSVVDNPANKYTLVDFWASWCAPCCAEIPELLKTKTEYDDLLTVYAVSLDYHPEHWHKAMASYEIEKSFVNIVLPRKHERYQYILDKFDVSAIPANFLLDKDRRIIATGLRGEDLKNKMKELTGK